MDSKTEPKLTADLNSDGQPKLGTLRVAYNGLTIPVPFEVEDWISEVLHPMGLTLKVVEWKPSPSYL